MKIVIGLKNGKSYQKELDLEQRKNLYNKVIGDKVKLDFIHKDCEFSITGGSDYTGVPMRTDIVGAKRKKILTRKSVGFRGKVRKKKFSGLRVKKNMAGNTIYEKTNQVNLKCIKGDTNIESLFSVKEEVKTEEAQENKS